MKNYKYLSEPRKPFFSVGKALIALLIILFNFWPFDTFAASNYYIDVYDCNRDSDGFGLSMNLDSTPVFIRGSLQNINGKLKLYKFSSSPVAWHGKAACLLTDEPNEVVKPVVIETCNYGAKIEDMIPVAAGGWSSGFFKHSSVSYKYKIETASDIKYACDILHRYDVICHTDNNLAVPSFRVDLIKDYPKYNSTVQMGYQGCLYDALLTEDLDNKWNGECYNATFYRTDSPSDTIGSVDFNPYSCQEKTCPARQSLDNQGVCQFIVAQCSIGQHSENGVCVDDSTTQLYEVNLCRRIEYTGDIFRYKDPTGEYQEIRKAAIYDCPIGARYSSLSSFESFARSLVAVNFPYYLTSTNPSTLFDRNSTSRKGFNSGYVTFHNNPNANGGRDVVASKAMYKSIYFCEDGTETSNPSSCMKICPNGVEVTVDIDCSTTSNQCPDGKIVNQGQNCATKICSDGSEIPFDYSCPIVDGGSGGSGSFDISELLTKVDKSLENQQYHIDESNNLKTHLSSDLNPVRGLETDDGLSFYERSYSGFDDVLEKHEKLFDNSKLQKYTEKWTKGVTGSLSLSSLYSMCFDLGSMGNYGCLQIPIDSRIWLFIRSLMIFSSVILARKLTLGG